MTSSAAELESDNCLSDWKTVFGKAFDYVSSNNLRELNLLLAEHGGCIRGQIRRRCPKPIYVSGGRDLSHEDCLIDETFIRLFSFSRRLECSDALCSDPDSVNWEEPRSKQLRGDLLMWFDIASLKTGRKISATDIDEIVSTLLRNVHSYLQRNDFGGLRDFLNEMRLPNLRQINDIGLECSKPAYSWESDLACSWKKFLKELVLLISMYHSENDKVIRLTTTFDYNEKLRQINLKNVVDNAAAGTQKSLEQFADELTSVINDRFEQLGDYFTTLADFDGDIAKADIGYIVAALDKFSDDQRKLSLDFDELALRLITVTQTVARANAAAAWYKAFVTTAFAAVSASTGDMSGFIDAWDKTDEATEAALEVAKSEKLTELISDLTADMDKIADGFKDNRLLLDNAHDIVLWESGQETADPEDKENTKWEFLQAYNDYDPQVYTADIEKIGQGMSNVLDVIKEVLDGSTQFAAATAGKGQIVASTTLEDMASLIPQITALMDARFEYQFDYMDSLAAYLRAQLAQSSVQQLQNSIEESRKSGSTISKNIAYNQAALTTLITSKTHTMQAVRYACNVLQYKNAGEMPTVCKSAQRSLSDSDITDVLAFLPENCVKNTNDGVYVSIPVSNEPAQPGTISLQDLYTSKKRATLQIPDVQWLVDHGWLLRSDAAEKVYYVKGFELFLLSLEKASEGRHVGVDISVGSSAPLVKGEGHQRYDIKPNQRYEFTYRENIPPCDKTEANPYELCKNKPLSKICVTRDGVIENDLDLYPSIFSNWIIEVPDLGSHTQIPSILSGDGNFSLQAKIMLCSKSPKTKPEVEVNERPRDTSGATGAECGDGDYYDRKAFEWRKCPTGSSAALGGYYCKPGKFSNFFFVCCLML